MELIQNLPISINFFLNGFPKLSKSAYTVYAQIIVARTKATLSLKMTAALEDFDTTTGTFNANKQFNAVRNRKLVELRDRVLDIYLEHKRHKLPISAQSIKQQLIGVRNFTGELLFIEYYKSYVQECRQRPKEYGEGVIGHYVKTQTHLERFLKQQGWQKIKVSELSRKFIERFEHYLLTTPNQQTGRSMNNNTCTTYLRKLKAAVNAAIRKEIINTNPFNGFKLRNFRHANKVMLTQEELDILKTCDLGGNKSLERVRDVFLFSCETGLRHSDIYQLSEEMIQKDRDGVYWLSLIQHKTSDAVEIPLTDYAIMLFQKYQDFRKENLGRVFPVLTNQKVNSALKCICQLAGLKPLTFHSSRHTFATLALEKGVDIKSVSSLLGHSSVKSTEIYAKLTRKRKVDVLRSLNGQHLESEILKPQSLHLNLN
jgi:integrase